MGAFFDEIPNDNISDWIKEQKVFFVSTAPLSASHHVNCSPKGHDSFHLVSKNACWYLDLTGSGNETISHLQENGRITILFCAFVGSPRIVRLFGTGRIFLKDTPEFDALVPPNDPQRLPGTRSIIWIDIHKVGTSCGYSVPFFEYKEDRMTLINWAKTKEAHDELGEKPELGLKTYQVLKNSESMDGLPGMSTSFPRGPSKPFKQSTKSPMVSFDGQSGALILDVSYWGCGVCLDINLYNVLVICICALVIWGVGVYLGFYHV